MLRESFPWTYELGVDAYRALIGGDKTRENDAVHRFFQAIRVLRRGPFLDELGDKSAYMVIREMEHLLFHETEVAEEDRPGDEKPPSQESA